jgi:parallel beta-helix repeat protein
VSGGRAAVLALLAAVLVAVVTGCAPPAPDPLPRREVAAPAAADPAQPCIREAPATAPAAPPAPAGLDAQYQPATRTIVLAAGTGVTLPALADAVNDPAALREVTPGEWQLGADLVVQGGAELRIAAPDVRWLKLNSDAGRFVNVTALGGRVDVSGTCVTSWDTTQNRVDTEHEDGRSYLLARDGAEMSIDKAEIRYLGHGNAESYGLSWRTEGTVGGITDSVVSHLYYGLYSYEVSGLQVTGNEFHDNVLYGIDPHTGSHDLRIERNAVHDNGKHGIILAEDCTNSVIRDNLVYRNAHHGIVLYLHSDRNVIESNETFANTAQGININESGENAVRGNRVYDNGESGIGVTQTADGTVVEGNQIRGNQQDGVRAVSEATATTVRDNVIAENVRHGVYVDTGGTIDVTGNTIVANRTGIASQGVPVESEEANTVHGNHEDDIVVE